MLGGKFAGFFFVCLFGWGTGEGSGIGMLAICCREGDSYSTAHFVKLTKDGRMEWVRERESDE